MNCLICDCIEQCLSPAYEVLKLQAKYSISADGWLATWVTINQTTISYHFFICLFEYSKSLIWILFSWHLRVILSNFVIICVMNIIFDLTFFRSCSKILHASYWLSCWCPTLSHPFCHINACIIAIVFKWYIVQVGTGRQPAWLCASLHIMTMFMCKIPM